MKISNKPRQLNHQKFYMYAFPAARDAFAQVIASEREQMGIARKILLPAFIGYSVREGSGIFDPVKNSGITYEFYKMDSELHIQVDALSDLIKANPGAILLIVHYWGFVDPAYENIKSIAREKKCIIVEDFAHGLFTFFKNPVVDFDYGFFSLHKMFPYNTGGVFISRLEKSDLPSCFSHASDINFFEYNLAEISRTRLENYQHLRQALKNNPVSQMKLLRENTGASVPQSFPILLNTNHLKDYLYFKMNAAGYGVVSLYHQLIAEVDDSFVHEHKISSGILNLPIHQDVSVADLDEMVDFMRLACSEYEPPL